MQPALLDRTLSMPTSFFRDFSSGDLSTRVLAAQQLAQLVSTSMVTQALAFVFAFVNFIVLFWYSRAMAIVALVAVALTTAFILVCGVSIRRLTAKSVAAQRVTTAWIVQLIGGISKIRSAGVEQRLVAMHQDRMRSLIDAQASQTLVSGRLSGFMLAAAELIPAAFFVVATAGMSATTGPDVTTSEYVAFIAAFGTIFGATTGLVAVVGSLAATGPTLELAAPILAAIPEQRGEDPGELRGNLELRRVSFRYGLGLPFVLRDVSLSVEEGELVALVGPSGSGKSTVLRLLLGFEKPEAGEVLVDGRELSDLDPVGYRSQLGVVVQDGRIMQASVRDNVLAGESLGDQHVWEALDSAALAEEIREMPMQLETLVDPATVSGGQAQRILLARALLRKPKIIILDEATSALDNESQDRVRESLSALGVTRVVVAHRLSTVERADRIVVLEGGAVTEVGTFAELMDTGGRFSDLAGRQLH